MMKTLFFIGIPKSVTVGGRTTIGSPIDSSALPATAFQILRYKTPRTSIMVQIDCDDADENNIRVIALATAGIQNEITNAQAQALIQAGTYK